MKGRLSQSSALRHTFPLLIISASQGCARPAPSSRDFDNTSTPAVYCRSKVSRAKGVLLPFLTLSMIHAQEPESLW